MVGRYMATRDGVGQHMTAAETLAVPEGKGLRLVRFLWCGNDGTLRAKATARPALADRLRGGIGVTVATQAMNGLDHLQPLQGLGPVGGVRLRPCPGKFLRPPARPAGRG